MVWDITEDKVDRIELDECLNSKVLKQTINKLF